MRRLEGFKVAFVAGTLGQGGAERQLYYMLKTLARAGARLKLYSLTRGEFWQHAIEELGVEVVWIGQRPSRFLRLLKLIEELRKDRPEVVQSQHFYTNIYVALAAHALGLRNIGAIRNDVKSEVAANGKLLGTLCLRLPDKLAANSANGVRNAQAFGIKAERIFLLPNVVDTELFRPAADYRGDSVRLLFSGRFVEAKRPEWFISVFADLAKTASVPVRATMLGDGPLRASMEEMAGRLGVEVQFTGNVSDPERYYRQADILVLTSWHEGTPNVIMEAMASGLPVVATRVGGVEDLVSDRTGYLCDTYEELADRVRELVHNPAKRLELGREARSWIERKHSFESLRSHLQSLYQESKERRGKRKE